jgi:hypothetical protein
VASEKSYSTESRLDSLWNHLGPVTAGGGNGQRQAKWITANQSITSTTPVVVGANSVPLSWSVVAGSYELSGLLVCVIGATATQPVYQVNGGGAAVSLMLVPYAFTYESGTGESTFNGHLSALATPTNSPTASFPIGAVVHFAFRGILTFTGAGTLDIRTAENTNLDPFTMSLGSMASLESAGQTT